MQKITPYLWFDNNAEEAINFYTSIFKNARVVETAKLENAGPNGDDVFTAVFELEGQRFMALNGGPVFQFSPAISFYVDCKTQEEVDYYWDRLLEGGAAEQCGWLKDKFGVSWQIVPGVLNELLNDPDRAKADRVMQAMLQMVKLDIAGLKRAYESAPEQADLPHFGNRV